MKFFIQKQTYIYIGLASVLSAFNQCIPIPKSKSSANLILKDYVKQSPITENKATEAPYKFEKAIEDMRKAADKKRGVTWTLEGDKLLRDATQSTGIVYASQDYVVQILSICRAATRMCELYKREKEGKQFEIIAQISITHHQDNPRSSARDEEARFKEVKDINRTIVGRLHKIFPEKSQDDLNKELRIIENYAGLEDTHYDITTIFKVKGKKFAIEDMKWLELTDAQKKALNESKTFEWYKALTDLERHLVDYYVEKLKDNKHYIPTQIRNIPGCRNAYKKSIWAYDENGNVVILGKYGHLATLSALNTKPEVSEQICKQNWDQLCNHALDREALKFVCLNHDQDIAAVGYVGEKQIVEQTKRVVGNDGFTCFPVNHMGRLSTPVFKPQVLALCNDYEHILKDQDSKTLFFRKKLKALQAVANCSDASNKIQHNFTDENLYAEVSADYLACKSFLNSKKHKYGVTEVVSCKSGKDRTGYISFLSDGKLIHSHVSDKATEEDIHNVMASTGHVQLLASLNGGMPGRFGIKGDGIKKHNVSKYAHDLLFCKSALLTSIPR